MLSDAERVRRRGKAEGPVTRPDFGPCHVPGCAEPRVRGKINGRLFLSSNCERHAREAWALVGEQGEVF